ncbi:MAG: TRAM domain-containing protein [Waddliaceae bacterium]
MMSTSKNFFRFIVGIASVLFFTAYAAAAFSYGLTPAAGIIGFSAGIAFTFFLMSSEYLFRHITLKAMNTMTLGLFFGYLLGQAMVVIFTGVLDIASLGLGPEIAGLMKGGIVLFGVYFGVVFAARAADEVHVSIPFVKFKPTTQKKKDILIDRSVLSDPRIIDLAATGLFDHHFLIPDFIREELQQLAASSNEVNKSKVRRALEILKKMEGMTDLHLKFVDTDFPELKDAGAKLTRLARMLDANILTTDINLIEQTSVEGIKIVNINYLAKALKPLTQTGEFITIKVQRYGKEARQGVGYLDDGTMVVINGGAEFIGETIKAQVLSVKHTSSGRMIFCNALDEEMPQNQEIEHSMAENTPDSYFAL